MYYRLVRKIYQVAAKKMCKECQGFIKEGSKILDLGCGSGIVGKEFQKFFNSEIFGIDIEDKRIEKIPFQVFDGEKIPFPEKFFDVVLISFVLHHAKNPVSLLNEAKRVSKEKIIIFEDIPEDFFSKIYCLIHGISFDKIFKNPNKSSFKNEKEWEKIFKEIELKLIFKKKITSFLIKKDLFVLNV